MNGGIHRIPLIVAAGAAAALCACRPAGEAPVSAAQPVEDGAKAIETLPLAPPAPPPPVPSIPPPAYTESFASLHAGRLEALRLVHGLGDRMDPNTILPYADTVNAGDAEPWRLKERGYAMVLVRPDRGNVTVTSAWDPFDFGFKSLPSREPDGFEHDGLARLEAGEELVIEKRTGIAVRVLGPIRVESQCRSCHPTWLEDALVAAYSYAFEEMPDD